MSGWTKAEYDQCPELASRLHSRILELQDQCEVYRTALERISSAESGHWGWVAHEALTTVSVSPSLSGGNPE